MGADNVDIFKNIIFQLPSLRSQLAGIIALSFVYSGIAYLAFRAFAPLDLYPLMIPVSALLIYLLPTVFAGELFHRVIPPYPRHWSYFLALVNQLILFLYSLILSGANNPGNAWSIIWLAFITVYLSNILVLIMSVGMKYLKRIMAMSLSQPALLVPVFHIFIGRALDITASSYIFSFGALLLAAVFLAGLLLLVDYLIKSNTDVSAFKLTSGLLQNNRESLNLGFEAEPEVQTLQIDNGEELTMAAPWVHPGPLGGFGGGQLSDTVIEKLKESGEGFFLHVPCTHEEDLANAEDSRKIVEAVSTPEKAGEASKMIHRDYGPIEFYGRKFDGKKIVYLHAEQIDDYDIGVFMSDVDTDEVLLVDLHNHDIQEGPEKEVQYGTSEADELKDYFDDFLDELEGLKLHDYSAGFDVGKPDQHIMAMCERVGDQEVLLMGTDTNGVTQDLRDLQNSYRSEFEHVLLFSTDTHASIHDLANRKSSNIEEMQDMVENAVDTTRSADIGMVSQKTAPLHLLKNDYNGLVFSVNILIRLTLISLVLFYLLLILWIFF